MRKWGKIGYSCSVLHHMIQLKFLIQNVLSLPQVYYKYIVDHYDDFPDIAIFTHASPHEHNDDWLDLVRCVRPNATYFSINLPRVVCRESWNGIWARYGIWLEQCLRDTLRITWDNITVAELNEKVPPTKSIRMCTHCCQQFLIR